ncbi:MAG: beta-N-acetylhexosaminidase [Alphaproteobacteria bacterium]|jgi:beta-N-acetylhexosaminidase
MTVRYKMLAIKKPTPLVLSLSSTVLDDETKSIFRHLAPVGFILFKRNCENAAQLKKLCADLKEVSPLADPLIFIDQEGGRVNRIDWEEYMAPAGRTIGELFEKDIAKGLKAAQLNGYVLAAQLREYGINVNCLPLADVATKDMHDVIGDRAFSTDPKTVAALCASTITGLLAGGVWPIIKHAPGHGRALSDSHKNLPVVDASVDELRTRDFYPFIINKECPLVMTAHILYPQIDAENCTTNSSKMITDVLKGEMGLKGLIVSDDLNMQALTGNIRVRAEKALNAGCDLLLHCSGKNEEMRELIGLRDTTDITLKALENLPALGKPNTELLTAAKLELKELLA